MIIMEVSSCRLIFCFALFDSFGSLRPKHSWFVSTCFLITRLFSTSLFKMAQEIKRSAKHVSHAFTPNPTTAYATYCTATTRFIMRVCWDISGFLWETIKPLIKQLKDTGSLPESLVVIRVDHSMDVEATSGTSRISKKPAKRSKKAKNTEGDLEYCYKCKLQDVEVDIPLSGALNTTGQLQVKLEEVSVMVCVLNSSAM